MNHEAFRAELSRLGLTQGQAGRVLDVETRTIRRWLKAEKPVPRAVALLLPKLSRTEVARIMRALSGTGDEQ